MCFSASASFMAAAVTGAVGLACLSKVRSPRELPLAAMPLLFAAQQAVEGLLWLKLPVAPSAAEASWLTLVFLIYAKVFWPVYVPVTALLIEPDKPRRLMMQLILAAGIAIAIYFLRSILGGANTAIILGGHICYEPQVDLPLSVAIAYMAATCAAPLISSHAMVRLLGLIVLAGAALTYAFYWQAFTSVWCFFAAAASVVVLRHLAQPAGERAVDPAK